MYSTTQNGSQPQTNRWKKLSVSVGGFEKELRRWSSVGSAVENPMKPADSEDVLKQRLGQPVDTITARHAVDAMFAFYAEQRADDVVIEEDGDMLLYEWGIYSFSGPESFQFDITRQFIVTGEDEPYQLHLTLHFVPTDALRQIKNGNEWCHSPDELPAFRQSVESSAAFGTLADAKPSRLELYFHQC